MADGLTSISFVEDLGTTPATVNRKTGELYISKRLWRKMTPDQRLFMLLHEYGHVALNTTDEFEADQFAHQYFIKAGGSLKASVSALTELLSEDNPQHIARAKAQLERALFEDQKNKKGMQPSYIITSKTHHRANPGYRVESIADPDFIGFIGKKAAKRREKRQEAKQERKKIKAESKAAKREAKAQKKINNSEANIILAQQGINGRAQLASGILGGMAKVAGAVGGSIVGSQAIKALPSLIGGGGSDADPNTQAVVESIAPTPSPMAQIAATAIPTITGALASKINSIDPLEQSTQLQETAGNVNSIIESNAGYNLRPNLSEDSEAEEKKKNNTMLFVGIGAAALVIVLILVMKKS